LDVKELAALAKLLKQSWTKKDVLRYFNRMVSMDHLEQGPNHGLKRSLSRDWNPETGNDAGENDDAEPEVQQETFIR
jgi:hypothetical protein